MGLDMYAHRIDSKYKLDTFKIDQDAMQKDGYSDEEFYYWRKNYCLNQWMNNLFIKKGFDDDNNCVVMFLEKEDLYQLINDIADGSILANSAYGDVYTLDDKKTDICFALEALDILENSSDLVYYYAWG